jgi:hypothetical protein
MGGAGDFIKTYGDKAKALGAIIGLVVVVGGGGKWVYDKLEALERADEDVQSLEGRLTKLQDRVIALEKLLPASEKAQDKALRMAVDATRTRFLEDERAAAELRGTVVALITEVRVRHGQPGYLPAMRPRGVDPDRERVRAQIKQNKAASEALDMSLGRTIDAIPQKAPMADLAL